MKTLTNRPTRRTALGLIGATLAAPAAAFSEGVETLSGAAFGTRWRIAAPQGAGLGRLARPIEALFAGGAVPLPGWAAERIGQMEGVVERVTARSGAEAAPELPAPPGDRKAGDG